MNLEEYNKKVIETIVEYVPDEYKKDYEEFLKDADFSEQFTEDVSIDDCAEAEFDAMQSSGG